MRAFRNPSREEALMGMLSPPRRQTTGNRQVVAREITLLLDVPRRQQTDSLAYSSMFSQSKVPKLL